MSRVGLPLLLVALLLGASACGAREDPVDEDGYAIPWPRPELRFVAVDPPVVAHARWTPRHPQPVQVQVRVRGDVWMPGAPPGWRLDATGPAREGALDGFAEAFARRRAQEPPPPVELWADGAVRWGDVRDVLGRVLATTGLPARVRWAVRVEEAFGRVHQGARVTRAPPASAAAPEARLVLRPVPEGDDDEVEVELAVGTWSTRSRERDAYDSMGASTHAAWRAAAPAIRAALGDGDRATLRVRGVEGVLVPWDHVVGVLDLLLGLGVRHVVLPALDVELHLDAPEALGPRPPRPPDDPVVTPVVAFLATFLVLLGLAVTVLPAWFERSARKRPGGRRPP